MNNTEKKELKNLIKSKEALENISWHYVNDPNFQEWCNIIKQDLERLEIIEENYYSLNKEYEDIEFENVRLRKENEKLSSKIDDLLDDKLVLVVKNTQQDIFIGKLIQENENLKQAIEILKNKMNLAVYHNKVYNTYSIDLLKFNEDFEDKLSQQEYELLKEVLENGVD